MGLFKNVADIQTADMLMLPIPKLKDDRYTLVASEPSEFALNEIAEYGERAERKIVFLGAMTTKDWIIDTYIVKLDTPMYNLKLQDGEVINAKWVDIYEFEDMCSKQVIVPATIDRFNLYRDKIN